jgi:hypothetical protein
MSNLSLFENVSYTIRVNYPNPGGQPPATLRIFWSLKRNGQIVSGINFPTPVNFTFEQGIIHPSAQLTNVRLNTGGNITLQENDEITVRIEARNIISDTPVFLESSAIIKQRFPVPILNPITLRKSLEPSVILGNIIDAPTDFVGTSLFVGGPNPSDFTPTGINIGTINYQWKRDAINIQNATQQTYVISQSDIDSVISVEVTATLGNESTKRNQTTIIGDVPLNLNSRIGSHAGYSNYYTSGVRFVNLIYSSVYDVGYLVAGTQGRGRNFFGTDRFLDWTGDPYYTEDGWPFRGDQGALSLTNPVQIRLSLHGRERMWSILGLPGAFIEPPVATKTGDTSATYPPPQGIAGRTFTFEVSCYWEGQGVAVATGGATPSSMPSVTSVQFTGPDNQGPFGDGPRAMSKSTVSLTYDGSTQGRIDGWIIQSDPTGIDPLRNLVIIVSNVRDAHTNELIYSGFDHTTYRPFQLYPQWRDSMSHNRVIRTLQALWARGTQTADSIIHERARDAQGHTLDFEYHQSNHGETPLLTTGWGPRLTGPGFEKGFGAINRPTNAAFGNSLRAFIEICNQLGADLWWCHPWPVVAVGTRHTGNNFQNGNITFARNRGRDVTDPTQVGGILVDEEYIDGFVHEIEAYLRPDLKVYSEWVNEVWNVASSYFIATRIAWSYALRALAEEQYGGDGGLWFRSGNLQSPAINAGAPLGTDANRAMAAFSAAAGAALAEAMRNRLGQSSRKIVAVAAGQSNFMDRSSYGLGQLWAAMPKLFKQLDAVAHAPYRSPRFSLTDRPTSTDSDAILVGLGSAGAAWDYLQDTVRALDPYTVPGSMWRDSISDNGNQWNFNQFRGWKNLALDNPEQLDHPRNSYTRRNLPPGWPADRRRWNLQLVTYEGGNHYKPKSSEAKLLAFGVMMEPRYADFNLRYMETIFAPGPKGLTRDPQSAAEEFMYRSGMVPLGVVNNGEPMHSLFTCLISVQDPSYRHGMFWSKQWWNGQVGAPQMEGVRNSVLIGSSQWWNEENEE